MGIYFRYCTGNPSGRGAGPAPLWSGNTEAEIFLDMSSVAFSDWGAGKGDVTTTLLTLRTILSRTSLSRFIWILTN